MENIVFHMLLTPPLSRFLIMHVYVSHSLFFFLLFNLNSAHVDVAPAFYFPFGILLWYPSKTQILLFPNTFRLLCVMDSCLVFCLFVCVVLLLF